MTKKPKQAQREVEKHDRKGTEQLADQKRAGVTNIEDSPVDMVKPEVRGEHYHVEPDRSQHPVDSGDVQEETLDRDAPYNKSYGR